MTKVQHVWMVHFRDRASFFFKTAGAVRLFGGGQFTGIVQVMYQGMFGTVCTAGFDNTDASVVCTDLALGQSGTTVDIEGFLKGGHYYTNSQLGPSWLSNVACKGSEQQLVECAHGGWGNACDRKASVSISCLPSVLQQGECLVPVPL